MDATTVTGARRVRWLCQADWPAVCKIERGSFPGGNDWTQGDFLACLRQLNCIGTVAEAEGTGPVLGYLLHEIHETKLHLIRFAVHPGHRRQGVGARLVGRLAERMAGARRTRITADVPEENLGAQLFLKSLGFKATRVLRGGAGDAYRFVYRRPGQ